MKKNKVFTKKISVNAVLAFFLSAAILFPAQGRLVIDRRNAEVNYLTAISMINQLTTMKEQVIEAKKAAAAALDVAGLSDFRAAMQAVQDVQRASQDLKNALGESQQALGNIQSMFGASSFKTWGEFTLSMGKRKAAGDAVATNLMRAAENADKQVKSSYETYEKITQSLTRVEGQTEAAQALGAAIGVIVTQNQSFLALASAESNQEAFLQQKKMTKKQAEAKTINEYFVRANEAAQRVKSASQVGTTPQRNNSR